MKKIIFAWLLTYAALYAADLSGTWKGTVTSTRPDGSSKTDPAVVILKQDGDQLTGSAGGGDDDMHTLQNVRIAGEEVSFDVPTQRAVIKVVLKPEGETMSGIATREREGQIHTAKLSLTREASDVTGAWTGTLTKSDGGTSPVHFNFKQNSKDLSGSGGPHEKEQNPFDGGIVDGNQLAFEIPVGNSTMRFNLTRNGDDLAGKVTRTVEGNDPQTGTLTAKRLKN